jgi:tellurite resistance protein
MPEKKKNTPAFEAAYGLYIMGMEVANADGEIDENEVSELLQQCAAASSISKSAFVREAATLVVEFDQLKAYRAADSRNHVTVLRELSKLLKKRPESDRNRYLATVFSLGKSVAEASGGGWFSDGPVSDDEKKSLLVIAHMITDDLDIKKLNAWIEKNGI